MKQIMEILNMEIKNPVPVLNGLVELIKRSENLTPMRHLGHSKISGAQGGDTAPLGLAAIGINEHFLPSLLKEMGIRSVTFDGLADPRPMVALNNLRQEQQGTSGLMELLNDRDVLGLMRSFFTNCKTVAFDDWAGRSDVYRVWQLFLENVIVPLGNARLDFIFYLGDPNKKIALNMDEVLEVIGSFSANGRVTLALDESEALHFWEIMNGTELKNLTGSLGTSLSKQRYMVLYSAIGLSRLLIYSTYNAMLFSHGEQFVVSRKPVGAGIEFSAYARNNYVAGLGAGLLLGLDMLSAMALGLVVLGANGDQGMIGGQGKLLGYLQDWIAELDRPPGTHLYQ